MTKSSTIKFAGHIYGIKTLTNGGMQVTISMDGDIDAACVAGLVECRQNEAMLKVSMVPVAVKKSKENAEKENNKSGTSRKRRRYPYRS